MDNDDIVNAAREQFDCRLHAPGYAEIHADDEHRQKLIALCAVAPGKTYLDIGTGNGYVAFALAKQFKDSDFRGLDIARAAIARNEEIGKHEGMENIAFDVYDGGAFPYRDAQFSGCVSRYAFHHFPDADRSIAEIARVTGSGGFFILADPVTLPEDGEGFIDRFQALATDGHMHFYTREEIEPLFARYGFFIEKEFYSRIRYPRNMSGDYENLFRRTPRELLDAYTVEITGEKVYITVTVMNIFFRKAY
jgi:ubiquinone/menaquinone biosynthesis C-methylase UbiE